ISKPVVIALLPVTPMLPDKPEIAIWYRNPLVKDGGVFTSVNINLTPYLLYTSRKDEFSCISIVIGDSALSTQSGML
ncbi:CSS-motif domain-containing protein, partial [Enterobacter hormaechei]|uniref:CSS-motif domain-containing protein n=1 Tax=Enterobacter hormaechei TaxID=158836 RepID=UPI001951F8B7